MGEMVKGPNYYNTSLAAPPNLYIFTLQPSGPSILPY